MFDLEGKAALVTGASGGIGGRRDALRAHQAGASAVLAASIFHDDHDTPQGIKRYLATKGVPVRS